MEPYRRTPSPPIVAVLTPEGRAVSEHGETLDLDSWPDDTRLWASYATVYDLVRAGRGEALCWNHEEIRWRHRRFEEGWVRRASDANVVKIPFDELALEMQLRAFANWRDWLARFGAAPIGTSGAAAWSLLRARLERTLFTSSGDRPPLRFTVGGRQQLGPAGKGSFGACVLVDLPAAYASTLAGLRYGGQWLLYRDRSACAVMLERYGLTDHPVFVRARVRVPKGLLGPLVKRDGRRPRSFLEAQLLADHSGLVGTAYPSGRVIQGVWTWEEIVAATAAGCKLLRVLAVWVHRSEWWPFRPWWQAVEEGRREHHGLAEALIKVTGNALWGRFCMDASVGVRSIRSRNGTLVARTLSSGSGLWPAHDLAETVSGRVRARLFALMVNAGDDLISAHTDGAWLKENNDDEGFSRTGSEIRLHARTGSKRGSEQSLGRLRGDSRNEYQSSKCDRSHGIEDRAVGYGWRLKQHARRLDLLDPQTIRYFPDPPMPWEPAVVYAGMPAERAPEEFERAWKAQGFA